MINRSALAFLLLALVFSVQTGHTLPDQPSKVNDDAGDQVVIDNEKAVWEAIRTKQVEKLRTFLAPEYTAIYPFGVRDLQEELDHSATGYLINYSIEPLRLTHGDGAPTILLYRVTATAVEDGKEKLINMHASSVWVKRDGGWKVVFHTAMPAAD